jgi:proteasome assembly chaperone (PAC2) family protein
VAKRENIPAVNLWVPIPFYLIANEDPRAWKKVLEFFDKRFDLKIDFTDLDQAIQDQDEKLTQARLRFPDIDAYIRRLESNIMLSEEENERLVREIEEFLGETSF